MDECPICLNMIQTSKAVWKCQQCKNCFHAKCIRDWHRHGHEYLCPLCKFNNKSTHDSCISCFLSCILVYFSTKFAGTYNYEASHHF